jgi:hypothetical protein
LKMSVEISWRGKQVAPAQYFDYEDPIFGSRIFRLTRWQPDRSAGKVAIAGISPWTPAGWVDYFVEPFDDLITNPWVDYSVSPAQVSIDSAQAYFQAPAAGKDAGIKCQGADPWPTTFIYEQTQYYDSSDWSGFIIWIYTGRYRLMVYWLPGYEQIAVGTAGDDIMVDMDFVGQTVTWRLEVNEPYAKFYINGVLKVDSYLMEEDFTNARYVFLEAFGGPNYVHVDQITVQAQV